MSKSPADHKMRRQSGARVSASPTVAIGCEDDETRKHDGSLPLIGVNTFLAPGHEAGEADDQVIELARSTDEEKQSQLRRLADFHARHAAEAPATVERLQAAALAGDNLFAVLMDAVRVCSLGQITDALFEVGGRYRRNV